jgi:hypothetical protein
MQKGWSKLFELDTFESVRRRHPRTAPFSLSGLTSSIEDWEDRADRPTGEMDLFLFCRLFGRLRSSDIFLGRSGHKPNSFIEAGLSTVPTGKPQSRHLPFEWFCFDERELRLSSAWQFSLALLADSSLPSS